MLIGRLAMGNAQHAFHSGSAPLRPCLHNEGIPQWRIKLACAILAATGLHSAQAATPYLPAPIYEAEVHAQAKGSDHSVYQDSTGIPGHYSSLSPASWSVSNHSESYCCGFDTSASTTTSNAGGGSLSASATSNNFIAAATARMSYYFTLVGPDADYVSVTVSGYGYAEGSSPNGFDTAKAEFTLRYTDPVTRQFTEVSDLISNHEHHDFSETFNLKPNISYYTGAPQIIMTVVAGVGTSEDTFEDVGYGGSARAYIDPIFTVTDPALASQYQFVGIPTAPAVPEPESWALMLVGLGILAVQRTRRSTVV